MRTNKGRSAQIVSVPAPVGGLNARDAISAMPPTDAVIMENLFPGVSAVASRRGSIKQTTNLVAVVNSMAVYNGNTSKFVFAGSNNAIYDVTAVGAAAIVVAVFNDNFQSCQMGTVGGRFLMLFNGTNPAQYFDGAVWSATTIGAGATQIANVNPNVIINCNIYKNRLYLVEKNTANVWYLPINQVYGAATKLDLSSLLKNGSTILAMATWSIDDATGVQEYAVFISDSGEIITYQGSDPSVATDFKIAARFFIGRPVGYRCYEQIGSDLIILCDDGAFPLSKSLLADRSQIQIAITDKIRNLISTDIAAWRKAGSANPNRWCIKLHPSGAKLIINYGALTGLSNSKQYVMNTITGAWTIFKGWSTYCFARLDEKLYFGSDTAVYQADTGEDDNTNQITINCQQAFQYFESSNQKQFTAIRPIIKLDDVLNPPPITLDYNFATATITPQSLVKTAVPVAARISSTWQSASGLGFSAAPRLTFKTAINLPGPDDSVEWQSTDIVFKTGGIL